MQAAAETPRAAFLLESCIIDREYRPASFPVPQNEHSLNS